MEKSNVTFYRDGTDPRQAEYVKKKTVILNKFNTQANTREERNAVLRELLGGMDETTTIIPPFFCDYGRNIFVGKNFFANCNLTVLDCAKITIGDYAFIGPNVGIYAVGHPVDPEFRNTLYEFGLPITIGDNVWIGGHSVINPGVTIGNNVVIGSGSVVTRDIPDGVVAAGNPCRVIRKIDERDRQYFYKDMPYPESFIKEFAKADKDK